MQGLGAGQFFTDTFTYAIRMANGTLSWATVQVRIPGVNDAATTSGTSTGNAVEDTAGQLHVEGTLTVSDADVGQSVFQAPAAADLDGDYGTFVFNQLTGEWTYDLDHAKADHLAAGVIVHDTMVVTSLDGTTTKAITITVTGTNDAPEVTPLSDSVGEDGPSFSANLLSGATDIDSPVLSIQNPSSSITSLGGRTLTAGTDYTITGGVFALTAAGFALFNSLNTGQQDSFVLSFEVSDGLDAAANTLTVTVIGQDDSQAPIISSDGGGTTASITIDENTTAVTTVAATDADVGDTVTYAMVGGADMAKFSINTSSGALTFLAAPNFEAPTDAGGNNVYDVIVQASDQHGATDTQSIAVTVANVNEPPTGFNFILSSTAASGDTGNNGLNSGSIIGTFQPTGDPDSSTFTFGFSGPVPEGFTISSTGVLSTNDTVDVNDTTPYSVTVVVSDGVNTFTTPLKIWVLGVGVDTIAAIGTDIDIAYGGNGNDILDGTAGSDALLGGAGTDTLTGGLGADQLHGGAQNDAFVYTAVNESLAGAGNRDTIFDFATGEKITLTAIDANTTLAGNQDFAFVVDQNVGVVNNSVTWHQASGNTYVHGDNNGDGVVDFEIEILGLRMMTASDFNL